MLPHRLRLKCIASLSKKRANFQTSSKRHIAETERFWRTEPALRQIGPAHQITVALARRPASLVERPHHQALSAPRVTRRKHSLDVRRVFAVIGLRVGTPVPLDAELFQQRLFRP